MSVDLDEIERVAREIAIDWKAIQIGASHVNEHGELRPVADWRPYFRALDPETVLELVRLARLADENPPEDLPD